MFLNKNECRETKIMRNSRQPSTIQVIYNKNQRKKVGYFNSFVGW